MKGAPGPKPSIQALYYKKKPKFVSLAEARTWVKKRMSKKVTMVKKISKTKKKNFEKKF